jgi:hypothetical protein
MKTVDQFRFFGKLRGNIAGNFKPETQTSQAFMGQRRALVSYDLAKFLSGRT